MSLRAIFTWTLAPAVVCFMLALTVAEAPNALPPSTAPFDWRMRDLPPVLKRYLLVVALFALACSSDMFLLLRARELGVTGARIPLLWATVSIVAVVGSAPLASLSDRWRRIPLLVIGYMVYAACYAALGTLTTSGPRLLAVFIGYGIFKAATEGVEKALVADLAPTGRPGTAFGWFNLTAGVMLLPASLIFGWLYQTFSPLAAFGFSATCAFAAAVLLAVWVRPPVLDSRPTPGLSSPP